MPKIMQDLIKQYVEEVKKIYGSHVRQIILYGSYARGDFRPDSDVDIMILADISDLELKAYAQQLSYMTYDFNMDHDTDIKPIAKSEAHFNKWIVNYPFYSSKLAEQISNDSYGIENMDAKYLAPTQKKSPQVQTPRNSPKTQISNYHQSLPVVTNHHPTRSRNF